MTIELKQEFRRVTDPDGVKWVQYRVEGVEVRTMQEGGSRHDALWKAIGRELDKWIEEEKPKSLSGLDLACIFIREFDKCVGKGMLRDNARHCALRYVVKAHDKREAEIREATQPTDAELVTTYRDGLPPDTKKWMEDWQKNGDKEGHRRVFDAGVQWARAQNNDWFPASELDIETKDPERWVQCWDRDDRRGPYHQTARWTLMQPAGVWCREVVLPEVE